MAKKPKPVVTEVTHKKSRDRWRPVFLRVLGDTLNVSKACEAAGIARKTAYEVRNTDADFAAEWTDVLDRAIETAEGEMYRRAVNGTDKPVYQRGQRVGLIREYSDTLLIFLLKAHRPDRYRDTDILGQIDLASLSDEQLERIANGEPLRAVLAPARPRAAGTPPPTG